MEAVVKQAQDDLGMYGKKTILFIDEIHRFNKGQQDYLLPLWRTEPSFLSGPQQRIHILR